MEWRHKKREAKRWGTKYFRKKIGKVTGTGNEELLQWAKKYFFLHFRETDNFRE